MNKIVTNGSFELESSNVEKENGIIDADPPILSVSVLSGTVLCTQHPPAFSVKFGNVDNLASVGSSHPFGVQALFPPKHKWKRHRRQRN